MCDQGDVVGSTWKLSANEETLRHETSDNIHQASLCIRPRVEQIWVLMQAKYHLLAETLRRKMLNAYSLHVWSGGDKTSLLHGFVYDDMPTSWL